MRKLQLPDAHGRAANRQTRKSGHTSGNCSSPSGTVTVNADETFAINTQPASQVTCPGSNVTFTVGATGNSLSYQWRWNGLNLTDSSRFTGCTSPNLTINNVFATAGMCASIPTDNHAGAGFGSVRPGDAYSYSDQGCTTFDLDFTNLTADPSGTIYVGNCTAFAGWPQAAPAWGGQSPAPGLIAWSLVGQIYISSTNFYFQLGTNGNFQVPPYAVVP